MKIGAVQLEDLETKHSFKDALVLDVGADEFRNSKIKYPNLFDFVFDSLTINKYVTLDIDSGRKPDVLADGRKFPFKDSSFDVVLLMSVLEHCYQNFENIVTETNRILNDNEIVIAFLPFFLGFHENDYWRFTYEASERLFKDFKTLKLIPVGGPISVGLQTIINLVKPNFLRSLIAGLLSPSAVFLDKRIWGQYKKRGKTPHIITRGFFLIGEK